MTLTPEQKTLVREVLASGAAASEEEAVTAALTLLRDRVAFDLEGHLGMSLDDVRKAVDAGRAGPFAPWEGTDAFTTRMRRTHGDRLGGRSFG
ncbi:hypothetical protein [uncultured Rhodospira sp.]|uniref:ribbon-helix-helix domain-containing protein n=1 Tax=uncultured Rhodospira sp. TaxID=1936189 RepID=UPI00261C0DA4|nr:hypothetical protein [uncultured Rhodospira sp.]